MRQTPSFRSASGAIPYNMTNDYMFRYILQKNKSILKALLASLLHLNESDIKSIEHLNPIELGKAINQKEFIMDIQIMLNNNQIIDLEMQVINEKDWTDRSLSYLCRQYDNLSKGDDYTDVISVRNIGILDFNLFDDDTELYSSYYLKNDKTGRVYNSKFIMSVLNLRQTENATEEDRLYNIDTWAKLFKSKTWEELKMIADKSKKQVFEDTAEQIYNANNFDEVAARCQARQDYIYWENRKKYRYQKLKDEYDDVVSKYDDAISENEKLKAEIAKLKAAQK